MSDALSDARARADDLLRAREDSIRDGTLASKRTANKAWAEYQKALSPLSAVERQLVEQDYQLAVRQRPHLSPGP
jgi:hypothetical protein